ncbi:MAG: sensor domain-containing diguanylate cyclase [Acidobacteria bacterium]|nr:sensor domain-containing diguanylate cyclase [Acidobacteriota bacterium]
MSVELLAGLLVSDAHIRLVRFLVASPGGVAEAQLTPDESEAAAQLVARGVSVIDDGVVRLAPEIVSDAGLATFLRDAAARATAEAGRLRADYEEISGLLSFLQELYNALNGCRTIAELFRSAFRRLASTVSFDIGCAVMLEQNLDLYVSKLPKHEELVGDRLVEAVRKTLGAQLSASFASTDVVVRGDFSDLPGHDLEGDPIARQAQTLLMLENRAAGALILYRAGEPFSSQEQRILELLANQIAILLGNIRANEQIQNLADTDDLTGIWNKRAFRRQLQSEVERSRTYTIPLSLILFDIDDFKLVNDSYGHVMGDVLLSELCGAVRETLRPPDLFARFGGDEFAVILPHTDLPGARSVAERMIKNVRELRIGGADDGAIRCTISIGMATLDATDKGAPELVSRADQMLYEAKRLGKDRFSW